MAQLTLADYRELRKSVYSVGLGKEELKARPSLPSEAQMMAAFQGMEDDTVDNFAGIKATIDAALGFTTTLALAQKLYAGYLKWKIKKILGV